MVPSKNLNKHAQKQNTTANSQERRIDGGSMQTTIDGIHNDDQLQQQSRKNHLEIQNAFALVID